MSAVKKRSALKKLLVLIALLRDVFKAKTKMQETILSQMDFLKNRMKKHNFKKSNKSTLRSNKSTLRSNKSTLLIQHDVICGTDNAFPTAKLSKLISHEHGNKIA